MPKANKYPRGPQVTVDVSKKIIEASKGRDSSHCMIAEAIKEAFPQAQKISVDLQTIRFSDPARRVRYTYLTPRSGQVGLVQFDQGMEIEPFSLRLRGAHVTAMYQKNPSPNPDNQKRGQVVMQRRLSKQRMRATVENGGPGAVVERIGGQTAPVMRDKNNIPMSRRREFGIRAFTP